MKQTRFWLLSIFCSACTVCPAQPQNGQVVSDKLTESVYRFVENDIVNILVMTGPDGVLLVDTGYDSRPARGFVNSPAAVWEELQTLGHTDVRYIINTHTDLDHAYGNAELRGRGIVIAHRLGRERLAAIPDFPSGQLADITLQDSLTLYFNNDRIDVVYLPGHTHHDVVVHFHKAKIVCVGDLIIPDSFGSISATGDVHAMIRAIGWLYDHFSDDIVFVAGHDRVLKRRDLKIYLDMVQKTLDIITRGIKSNQSMEEMQKQDLLKDWHAWDGRLFPELNANRWIQMIYTNIIKKYKSSLADFFADMMRQSGATAARIAVLDIIKTEKEKYYVTEYELNLLGYRYLAEKNLASALAAFNLAVELYPNSWNVYDSLGEACLANGDTLQAIKNYRKALHLNNNAESAKNALRALGQKL